MGDLGERIGLVHELRQLRGAEELAHRRRRRLGVDQVVRHHRVDIDRAHALLDRALHAQQADAVLIFHQLADRAHAAVAEIVDVVDFAAAVAQIGQRAQHFEDVLEAQDADRIVGIEPEAHVHLDPADGRQIVALAVGEQALEQSLSRLRRRRLAGAHDAIDVEQRLLAVLVLVELERVADVRANGRRIDVEDRQIVNAGLDQGGEHVLGQRIAGFDVNLAGFRIDDVFGDEAIEQILRRHLNVDNAVFDQLVGVARRNLLAGFGHDLAGLGVDQIVGRLHAAPTLGPVLGGPAGARALVDRGLIEGRQNLFARHAERIEQRRRRQLPLAVDADEHDVLGVELEIEPRAAIRDDARREQQFAGGVGLALVVIEEDARAAVHLGDDDALGAVDDERALVGHQRNVAQIDVLFLDVLDRLGAGFLISFEHDEAQLDLQRRGIGHVALLAFFDVELRLLEFVGDVFKHGAIGKIADRKHRLEHSLQTFLDALVGACIFLQELIVGALLHLDQVRHRPGFRDLAERFTDTLLTGVGQSHLFFPMRAALVCGPRPLGPPSAAHEPPVPPWLRKSPQEPAESDPIFGTSRAGDDPARSKLSTQRRKRGPLPGPASVCCLRVTSDRPWRRPFQVGP